jgi:hypothetical protein
MATKVKNSASNSTSTQVKTSNRSHYIDPEFDTTPEEREAIEKELAEKNEKRAKKVQGILKEKGEKKEKDAPIPSFYGTAVEIMCTDPDMTFEVLKKKMSKKGFEFEDGKSAMRTAYSQARAIFRHLRANKLLD